MRDKRIKISDISQEISKKLENQIMNSCIENNNFVEQLQITDDEINKFFDKDVQRDISTGLLLFYYYYYLKLYYIIYNYKISLTCNLDLVFSSLFQIVLDD